MARLAGMEAPEPEVTSLGSVMRNGLNVVLLAVGFAGCAGTPEKEQPLSKDTFPSFTAEWRSQGGQPVASAAAWTEAERKEFEDWRAWQEWRRKNPK